MFCRFLQDFFICFSFLIFFPLSGTIFCQDIRLKRKVFACRSSFFVCYVSASIQCKIASKFDLCSLHFQITLQHQGCKNFFLGTRYFRHAILLARQIRRAKKMRAQNQSALLFETQLEKMLFDLYYLNSTYSFHF